MVDLHLLSEVVHVVSKNHYGDSLMIYPAVKFLYKILGGGEVGWDILASVYHTMWFDLFSPSADTEDSNLRDDIPETFENRWDGLFSFL